MCDAPFGVGKNLNGTNYGNYTQTVRQEKENVENNPLLSCVPKGLPSAGLSSHCWRLNFKKILAPYIFFHSAIIWSRSF